ncbi:hypothetical protein DXG01_001069 [Tephrocybe rancida]|nr:hypothetical protein DXG01_001069 [Tephrocybe rancida]
MTTLTAGSMEVFTPDVAIPRKRQEIIHKLQNVVAPDIFSPRAVYDGKALLYSPRPLNLPAEGAGNFNVSLSAVLPKSGITQPRGVFNVKLAETIGDAVKTADMNRLIHGRQADTKTLTATNLLQLLIRQDSNQRYTNNGRAYFTPEGKRAIGAGLELWRGYFQSVRPTVGRMLVNVDTAVAAVYASGELIDVCMKFLGKNDVRALALDEKSPDFRALQKFLEKVHINTATTGKRVKTVHGLVPAAGTFVFMKDDKEMTVQLSPKKSDSPIVVPAEQCVVLPGQLFKRKIPDHLTKDMVDFATVKPADRLRQIVSGDMGTESPVKGYANSEFLVEAGMVIQTNPISITGKILETPVLWYGDGKDMRPRDGAWNLKGVKLRTPVPLECWGAVNFCPSLPSKQVEQFMKSMANVCRTLGMNTSPPADIVSGMGNAVERSLDALLKSAMGKGLDKKKMMVIAILPARAPAIRTRVKHWGDVTQGVLTQCLCEDKVKRANEQYWGNVGLKLNARFGGYNSLTQSSAIDALRKDPFIIMGADVGHPGPGIMKPSITSLVWSYDEYATRYAAFTSLQHPRVETIEGLQDMVKRAIIAFGMRNRTSPRRIVFFRDGVSEGEFDHILKIELSAMKAAFDDVWKERNLKDPKPTVTFIVVGKRMIAPETALVTVVLDLSPMRGLPTLSHRISISKVMQPSKEVRTRPACASSTAPDVFHATASRSSHYSVLADENFQNDLVK